MEAEGGLWSACQVQASVQVVLRMRGKGSPGTPLQPGMLSLLK